MSRLKMNISNNLTYNYTDNIFTFKFDNTSIYSCVNNSTKLILLNSNLLWREFVRQKHNILESRRLRFGFITTAVD